MPRIGILGGTFDPVHLGHTASAAEVADRFGLERVLLLLSARPPHKTDRDLATVEHRFAMLELAARRDPRFEVSDLEVRRPGASYTVDSLRELAGECPDSGLCLILGIDAYVETATWRRPEELLELADIIVTSRPGEPFPDDGRLPVVAALGASCYDPGIGAYRHSSGHEIAPHRLQGVDVSASEIRSRIAEGQPVAALSGAAVAGYIKQQGLYGARQR